MFSSSDRITSRRARSSSSSMFPSVTSVVMLPLRSARTADTDAVWSSSWRSSASREEIVCDSRPSPSIAERSSGGVSAKVSATVVSDSATRFTSRSAVLRVTVSSSSWTSYGDDVRSSGITEPSASRPVPAGRTSRNLAPSTVAVLIDAPVASPRVLPSNTVKSARTARPASSTSSTLPTTTPASRTSSPDFRPAASLNSAE